MVSFVAVKAISSEFFSTLGILAPYFILKLYFMLFKNISVNAFC
jgi:hypothetical protein